MLSMLYILNIFLNHANSSLRILKGIWLYIGRKLGKGSLDKVGELCKKAL